MPTTPIFIDPQETHATTIEGVTFALRTLTAREMFRVERCTERLRKKHEDRSREAMTRARRALSVLEQLEEQPDRPIIDPLRDELLELARAIRVNLAELRRKREDELAEDETLVEPTLEDVVEVDLVLEDEDLEDLEDVLRIGIVSWEGPGVPRVELKVERVDGCRMIPLEAVDLIRPRWWARIYFDLMRANQPTEDQRAE